MTLKPKFSTDMISGLKDQHAV